MLKSIRIISKKISFIVVFALCINITPLAHSESLWEKAQAGLTKGVSAVGKAIQGLDLGSKLKDAAQSTASTITSSLKDKLSKLQDVGPKTIIPLLLKNLEQLGSKIGYMTTCVIKGGPENCSSQERAAFIAIGITILALTAALIGLTVTVAATSKEVDAQVVQVAKEVEGWSPKAIFTRLQNTATQFKESIMSMKICLEKRQCTATQKKVLYATAATIAALVIIAVGVGVGALIYAQHKEAERKAAAQAKQSQAQPKETGPVVELGAYTDAEPSWKTKFMKQVSAVIKPVKKASSFLKEAYNDVQQKVKTGAAKTKEQVVKAFENALAQIKDIEVLVRDTFDVAIAQALNKFEDIKDKVTAFKNAINQSFGGQMATLGEQIKDLADYGTKTAKDIDDAQNAAKQLGVTDIFLAKWRSEAQHEAKKSKLLQKQADLKQQKEKFEEEYNAYLEEKKDVEPTGALPEKKQSKIKKFFSKKKKPEDATQEIHQQMAKFNEQNQRLAKAETELQQDITDIDLMIKFNQIVSKDYLDKIYPTIVRQLRALQLNPIGDIIANVFINTFTGIINAIKDVHEVAGKIGLIVAQSNIQDGLRDLNTGLAQLQDFTKRAFAVSPIITAPDMDIKEFIIAVINSATDFRVLKKAAQETKDAIKIAWNLRKPAKEIEESVKKLNAALAKFKPEITRTFKETIAESPFKNIPRAPAILLKAVGGAIRDLKIAFIDTLNKSSLFADAALSVGPGIYEFAATVNNSFGAAAKAPLINPDFVRIVGEAFSVSTPNIAKGIQKLTNALGADMPDPSEQEILAAPAG